MRLYRVALLAAAIVLGVTTTGHAAGYFADAPYDDEEPFVEWPANAFSLAVAVPSAVVAGVLCAPLGVATRSGVVSTMAGCALVADLAVGWYAGLVGGAPFKAIKAAAWDWPRGLLDDDGARETPAAAPPPAPSSPPDPIRPDVDPLG